MTHPYPTGRSHLHGLTGAGEWLNEGTEGPSVLAGVVACQYPSGSRR